MKNNTNKISSNVLMATWGGHLKSVEDQGILEGDAIVFGSEESPDRSTFKDFFTADTYVHPDDIFTTALYMEHGFSYRKPIGKAIMSKDADGWKAVAELDMNNDFVKSRFPEIKAGGWGFSTGAVGHVVLREEKNSGTHFITQWSVGELSLTRTPAEEKALIHSVKSLDDYYNKDTDDMKDEKESKMDMSVTPIENPILFDVNESDVDADSNDLPSLTNEDLLMVIIQMLIVELAHGSDKGEDVVLSDVEVNSDYPYLMSLSEKNKKLVPIIQLLLNKKKVKANKKDSPPNSEELSQDGDINQKLTVLKAENEELKASIEVLQSSFIEKEALLESNLALLSETQEQLQIKSEEFSALEEELTNAKEELESLSKSLKLAREANTLLTKSNFNK